VPAVDIGAAMAIVLRAAAIHMTRVLVGFMANTFRFGWRETHWKTVNIRNFSWCFRSCLCDRFTAVDGSGSVCEPFLPLTGSNAT
jgi:hypothetical protein